MGRNKALTERECRRTKRPDGMRMKTVRGYSFPDFMDAIASRYGRRICYRVFRTGEENDISYSQLVWYARSASSYLLSIGIQKGDRVAIIGESSPQWMVMYLGIVSIGAVAVPILPDFPERDVRSILEQSGARGVAVNIKQQAKVKDAEGLLLFRLDDLVHIPSIPDGASFASAPGYAMRTFRIDKAALDKCRAAEDDLASIIFTSGTTGASKGVMLTHMNILRTADLATDVYVRLKPGMKVLSILPMSHVYEFTIGQVLPLMVGLEITFLGRQPAVSILLPALSEVRPHVMLTVPLLIEKVYKAAVVPVLRDNERIRKLIANPLTSAVVYRTIGRKLKKTFGHRLVFFGIGGAPLDKDVEISGLTNGDQYLVGGYVKTVVDKKVTIDGPVKADYELVTAYEVTGIDGTDVKLDNTPNMSKDGKYAGEGETLKLTLAPGYNYTITVGEDEQVVEYSDEAQTVEVEVTDEVTIAAAEIKVVGDSATLDNALKDNDVKTIYLTEGTYTVDERIARDVEIIGDGDVEIKSIARYTDQIGGLFVHGDGNVKVTGVKFVDDGKEGLSYGIHVMSGFNGTLEITDCEFVNLTNGIYINDAKSAVISNNTFVGCDGGIGIDNLSGHYTPGCVVISDNTFTNDEDNCVGATKAAYGYIDSDVKVKYNGFEE